MVPSMYVVAKAFIEAGYGSTRLLQERFRISYLQAAILVDGLDELGVVGPPTGVPRRDLLIGPEDLDRLFPEDQR